MLCVCVADVMDVVFSVCIIRHGTVGDRVKCECSVMHMLYVCDLCASYGSFQCCVLHDLQFVNAGRGLQSWSHNCIVSSHEWLLLFTPSCCSECFFDL